MENKKGDVYPCSPYQYAQVITVAWRYQAITLNNVTYLQ